MAQVTDKYILQYESSGAREFQTTADQTKRSLEGIVVVNDKLERSSVSLEGRFKSLERQTGTTAGQLQKFEQVQTIVNRAVAQNPALQDRANEVLQRARERYLGMVPAVEGATKATSLARHELISLGRQGADVFTQLASGQSLFMIAAQQGPQILDVFASSQVKVGDAFQSALGWAGRFVTSTAGIATGIGAIAVGAAYMASQFSRASTTIEQALETQNRLLKEGKALLDARTSAESRSQLQSKEQTQFETLQNQLDLQIKLNRAMEEAADISRRRSTRPTEVPNEMGFAPTGFAALSDPGLDKMTNAFMALKEAQAAGLPGLKEYNAELAKIGMAHPELALIIQDMIKAGEAGLQLEFAAQRAKAMSDALAGIATNAQMAAVGLGSVAQFQLNNMQAEQAAAATERQAVATLQLAQTYPGISIEVAKQLAQHNAQLPVVQAVTGAQRMAAQYAADYANALAQGKSQADALAIATMNIQAAQASATASVLQQVEALKDQNAMLKAQQNGTQATTAAAIAYKNAIASGADETSAAALKAETLKNYMLQAASAASSYASNITTAAQFNAIQMGAPGVSGNTSDGGTDNAPGFTASFDAGWGSNGKSGALSNSSWQALLALQRMGKSWDDVDMSRSLTGDGNLGRIFFKENNDALKDLTAAVEANTEASLNPLYSGRGALKLGYYKAATGLEGVVQGSGGVDSVPINVMATPGEHIKFTPPGQTNDNHSQSKTIIQNNNTNIVFNDVKTSGARRSKRQFAQGFAQTAAAMRH